MNALSRMCLLATLVACGSTMRPTPGPAERDALLVSPEPRVLYAEVGERTDSPGTVTYQLTIFDTGSWVETRGQRSRDGVLDREQLAALQQAIGAADASCDPQVPIMTTITANGASATVADTCGESRADRLGELRNVARALVIDRSRASL